MCLVRPRAAEERASVQSILPDVRVRWCDATAPGAIAREGTRGETFDAVVSCMASRTGASDDAWRVDHRANLDALEAAQSAGARHFVLLSAICVQRPDLSFQFAKLAFEEALAGSGLTYSIVRPTAYFTSLAGQLGRVRANKPFLVFGNGALTACTPISERDAARYLVGCLDDRARHDAVLPVGGPGPALTPLEQGALLFEALGREPRFRHVPPALLDAIVGALDVGAKVRPSLAKKAEFARIGRHYARRSMLVYDAARGRYDRDATPSFGTDTLRAFFERLVRGEETLERGAHAVF